QQREAAPNKAISVTHENRREYRRRWADLVHDHQLAEMGKRVYAMEDSKVGITWFEPPILSVPEACCTKQGFLHGHITTISNPYSLSTMSLRETHFEVIAANTNRYAEVKNVGS